MSRKGGSSYPNSFEELNQISVRSNIFLDDGNIQLHVTETEANLLHAKVINPGTVYSNKGVNIPSMKLKNDIVTCKDKNDINLRYNTT
ncbi:MAG: pyruvate kinase [Candidatus Cloacimonadota bacterium]|nr:pyruvate kinase [Candidatus Cloacimonadota bacterium]